MDLQVVLFDHHTGPDKLEQLVFIHCAIAPLDQRQQHVKGASAELGGLSVDQQSTLRNVKLGGAEAQF